MVMQEMSGSLMKVWSCDILPKLSSAVNKLLSPEEEAHKFVNSTQFEPSLKEQETCGTCPQNYFHDVSNKNADAKTGKEKNVSHRVIHEKSHCVGNEEMRNCIEKNHMSSNLADSKSKQWKIGGLYNAKSLGAFKVFLLLMCLLPVQGYQTIEQDVCNLFQSDLKNTTGPFNASICEALQQNSQCPMGFIAKCFPFVQNITQFYWSCILNSTSLSDLLNEGQCLLVTRIEKSNFYLLQCYNEDDCMLDNITSPKPPTTNFPHITSSTRPTLDWKAGNMIIIFMIYQLVINIL